MKRLGSAKLILTVVLTSVLSAALAVSPASAADAHWVIIGDSWGAFLEATQRQKISDLGLDWEVTGLAVGGTTARQWAADEGGLLTSAKDLLASLPSGELALVYVSIGGNDFLGEYAQEGDAIFDRVEEDLRFVRDELLAANPDAFVLLGGYDILNFEQSALCEIVAIGVVGTTDPEVMNALSVRGADQLDLLADESPRTLSLKVLGSLQGTPLAPDLTSWSPAQYITFDCIHLTSAGYEIFNDDMFAKLRFLVRQM